MEPKGSQVAEACGTVESVEFWNEMNEVVRERGYDTRIGPQLYCATWGLREVCFEGRRLGVRRQACGWHSLVMIW